MVDMPTAPEIRFSIVIPCFDEEDYVGATLMSLEKQDFKGGYEVIVVDNNCTDNTVPIAKEYGARIVTENRPGVCWARQAGTRAAKGTFVISTDADTTFDTNWLSCIDSELQKNTDLVAICGPCDFVDSPWWGTIYPLLLFSSVRLSYLVFKRTFYITATNTTFKKSAWDGYDTSQTQGGDELSLLHQLRKKGNVAFTTSYKVHTSSRRLDNGLWYNVFVTFLFYYLGAYYINRLFKRTIIGSAPAYRQMSVSNYAVTKFAREAVVRAKGAGRLRKDFPRIVMKSVTKIKEKR